MTPASTPSAPPNASEDHTLATNPDRSKPAPPPGLLSPILRRIPMPHPRAEVKVAPADAAVIVVPDGSADVLFDGERTYTEGTTRTFVTAMLPDGQKSTYKVSVREGRGSAAATEEREVEAAAGKITVVDFTRSGGK